MKINLCETCSWFDNPQNEVIGGCNNPKVTSDCDDSYRGKEFGQEFEDGVCASCDEQRGYLSVGRKFGCIHHQSK